MNVFEAIVDGRTMKTIRCVAVGLVGLTMTVPPVGSGRAALSSREMDSEQFKGSGEKEFVLGSSGRLIVIEINGERTEYGAGDRFWLRWKNGILYVNNKQVFPPPDGASPRPEEVRRSFGDCPIVLRYVERHTGQASDAEVWTEAILLWDKRAQEAVDKATNRYDSLVRGDPEHGKPGIDPGEAGEMAARMLRTETDLVDSTEFQCFVRESEAVGVVRQRTLSILWKGRQKSIGVTLDGCSETRIRNTGRGLVSRRDFEEWCDVFEGMRQDGVQRTVTFVEGTVGTY